MSSSIAQRPERDERREGRVDAELPTLVTMAVPNGSTRHAGLRQVECASFVSEVDGAEHGAEQPPGQRAHEAVAALLVALVLALPDARRAALLDGAARGPRGPACRRARCARRRDPCRPPWRRRRRGPPLLPSLDAAAEAHLGVEVRVFGEGVRDRGCDEVRHREALAGALAERATKARRSVASTSIEP